MLLITAPSKTQKQSERHIPVYTEPRLLDQSKQLIEVLQHYTVAELGQLMNIRPPLAESTRQKIHYFRPPLTLDNSRQAIFTFQGDAYSSLTPELYSQAQLEHAQNHLRILSGLYGILRPLDLIFPYRLEMGCRLATDKWKNLYQFWGDTITNVINADCMHHADQTLVNLASTEYARVINRKKLIPRLVSITFQQKKGDGYSTIPIHSKRARGAMIHYVITNQLTEAAELRKFNLDGYRFTPHRSTADNWLFQRE